MVVLKNDFSILPLSNFFRNMVRLWSAFHFLFNIGEIFKHVSFKGRVILTFLRDVANYIQNPFKHIADDRSTAHHFIKKCIHDFFIVLLWFEFRLLHKTVSLIRQLTIKLHLLKRRAFCQKNRGSISSYLVRTSLISNGKKEHYFFPGQYLFHLSFLRS